jgi:hypothetical protein
LSDGNKRRPEKNKTLLQGTSNARSDPDRS